METSDGGGGAPSLCPVNQGVEVSLELKESFDTSNPGSGTKEKLEAEAVVVDAGVARGRRWRDGGWRRLASCANGVRGCGGRAWGWDSEGAVGEPGSSFKELLSG